MAGGLPDIIGFFNKSEQKFIWGNAAKVQASVNTQPYTNGLQRPGSRPNFVVGLVDAIKNPQPRSLQPGQIPKALYDELNRMQAITEPTGKVVKSKKPLVFKKQTPITTTENKIYTSIADELQAWQKRIEDKSAAVDSAAKAIKQTGFQNAYDSVTGGQVRGGLEGNNSVSGFDFTGLLPLLLIGGLLFVIVKKG